MRKYLMIVLVVILIVLAYFTVTRGVSAGSFKILSWNELVDNNEKLTSEMDELGKVINQKYPQQQAELNNSFKKLQLEKDRYAEIILYSSETELASATKAEEYETEFIWTKIGNYAAKYNKIDMKIDVKNSSNGLSGFYKMEFTLVGQYEYISDFIYSLENDSKLGFKIEKFYLMPEPIPEHLKNIETIKDEKKKAELKAELEAWKKLNLLHATFTVENIRIKDITSTNQTSSSIQQQSNNDVSNTTNP